MRGSETGRPRPPPAPASVEWVPLGGRLRATVKLLGGKNRRLTVALKVTTASGKILRGKRTYRQCA